MICRCHRLDASNLSKSRPEIDLFSRYVVSIDTLAKTGRFLPDIFDIFRRTVSLPAHRSEQHWRR